jgi:hypothetical protein
MRALTGFTSRLTKRFVPAKRQDCCGAGNNPLLHTDYVAHQRCAVILTVTQIKF